MDARPVERKPWAVLAYTVADDKGTGESLDAGGEGRAQVAVRRRRFRPDERGGAGRLQAHARRLPGRADRGAAQDAGVRIDPRRLPSAVARDQGQARSLEAARPEGPGRPERGAGQRAQRASCASASTSARPIATWSSSTATATGRRDCSSTPSPTTPRPRATMALTSLSDSLLAVGERAAVIVFRSCMANTLETAYQLRDAGEFMLASQSIVPIAGIWPWRSFLSQLTPDTTSEAVALAIGDQLAHVPRDARQPRSVRRRPVFARRSGSGGRDRRPVEGDRRRARSGADRRGPRGRVRGCPRSGAHRFPG